MRGLVISEQSVEIVRAAFEMRNSGIFGVEHFWDHAKALEAVGPQE
jgi:hypothetical protein